MSTDYLKRILTSKVYDVAVETPLELAPQLSARTGNRMLLKREDTQPVFSFKLRGAYNKMAHLPAAALARGVIAASAGNHAQGVALSAKRLGCKAVIVMPTTTPRVKIDAVCALGAEVVLHGESYSDAYEHALTLEKKNHMSFVHPFDDPDVIAGQGTIGMEILKATNGQPLDAIFVCVGGGYESALIGGHESALTLSGTLRRVRLQCQRKFQTSVKTQVRADFHERIAGASARVVGSGCPHEALSEPD